MYFIDYEKIRKFQELRLGELRFVFHLMYWFDGFIKDEEISSINKLFTIDLLHKRILAEVPKDFIEDNLSCKVYRVSPRLVGYIKLDGDYDYEESITMFPDKLTDLSLNEYRLLFKMLEYIDEGNIVKLNKQRKERFASELNISVNTLKKALMTLKQKGIMESYVYSSYRMNYDTIRTSISICLRESDFKKELST